MDRAQGHFTWDIVFPSCSPSTLSYIMFTKYVIISYSPVSYHISYSPSTLSDIMFTKYVIIYHVHQVRYHISCSPSSLSYIMFTKYVIIYIMFTKYVIIYHVHQVRYHISCSPSTLSYILFTQYVIIYPILLTVSDHISYSPNCKLSSPILLLSLRSMYHMETDIFF